MPGFDLCNSITKKIKLINIYLYFYEDEDVLTVILMMLFSFRKFIIIMDHWDFLDDRFDNGGIDYVLPTP